MELLWQLKVCSKYNSLEKLVVRKNIHLGATILASACFAGFRHYPESRFSNLNYLE
jgi:hypothetical protein